MPGLLSGTVYTTMITSMFPELKKEIKSNNEQMMKNNEDIAKLIEALKETDKTK